MNQHQLFQLIAIMGAIASALPKSAFVMNQRSMTLMAAAGAHEVAIEACDGGWLKIVADGTDVRWISTSELQAAIKHALQHLNREPVSE